MKFEQVAVLHGDAAEIGRGLLTALDLASKGEMCDALGFLEVALEAIQDAGDEVIDPVCDMLDELSTALENAGPGARIALRKPLAFDVDSVPPASVILPELERLQTTLSSDADRKTLFDACAWLRDCATAEKAIVEKQAADAAADLIWCEPDPETEVDRLRDELAAGLAGRTLTLGELLDEALGIALETVERWRSAAVAELKAAEPVDVTKECPQCGATADDPICGRAKDSSCHYSAGTGEDRVGVEDVIEGAKVFISRTGRIRVTDGTKDILTAELGYA